MTDLDINDDNWSLVISVKNGDDQAFDFLYRKYIDKLYNHIIRICKSEALTEDIINDVFLKIWENKENLDENLSFQSYLFTIARNHLLNVIKRASKEKSIYQEIISNAEKTSNNTQNLIYFNETSELFQNALNRLSPQRKLIFNLSRNEGLSYEEIATKLGIAKGTVNVQIVNSLKSIKKYFTVNGLYFLLIWLMF